MWGSKTCWSVANMHSFNFQFLDPPTHHPLGWVGVSTHVALFMCTVFHRNLFQLEYYMSVQDNCTDKSVAQLMSFFLKITNANVLKVTNSNLGRLMM